MPPEDRDLAYLWDMADAASAINEFVRGRTLEDYKSDRMLRAAVEREIEIIGEAARRISPATRTNHPEIPWKAIIGQRNFLAHEYDEVSDDAIWGIAVRRVPDLLAALRNMLPAD